MSDKKASKETTLDSSEASKFGADTVSAGRVRHIIGELYYQQFDILVYLTIFYYSLVTVGDLMASATGLYALIAVDVAVVAMLLVILVLERRGIINIGNIYLTPIPLAVGMASNVYTHIYYSSDPFVLVKGILLIFAFGIVSLLPWVFWLLLVFSFGAYAVAAFWRLGDGSGVAIGLGAGVSMLSYGGFAMRYNSVRQQIALTIQNEERAKTLEQVGKAKDSFIANMSHELRTPLTGLLGMIDVIDVEGLNEEQKKQLMAARTSAGTLQAIIADLLDVSSLDAGKLTLKSEPFNVDETVYSVVLAVQSLVKKEVKFTYATPKIELPNVIGDVSRFRQVLFNLIGNALKFTDKGSVVLGVEVLSQAEAIKLRCSIEDTGIGIPKDKLEHLFDRFEQVDSSATRGRAGTGLGLAIAQELITLMGSEIKVESELDKGTRFWFDIEFETSLEEESLTVSPDAIERKKTARDKPLNILVAEDNPVNQMLIASLLKRPGWQHLMVGDGGAALEAAETKAFDVILMDIQMPVLNGEDVIRKIRTGAGPNKNVPIIALTANCQETDIERYREAGMSSHVGKPISKQEFYDAIENLTKGIGK